MKIQFYYYLQFISYLEQIFSDINKSINEKISGTNFLELIKFLLIEKLNSLTENDLKNLKLMPLNGKISSKLNENHLMNYMKNKIIKIDLNLKIGIFNKTVWSSDLTTNILKLMLVIDLSYNNIFFHK